MNYHTNHQFFKKALFLVVAAMIFPFGLDASEIEGVVFRDKLTVADKTLNSKGAGVLRYWGFKAYVGTFYLEEGLPIEEALSDSAKRIEIEYLRPIRRKDFGPATDKGIFKNVDAETFTRLRPQIDYHNSLYEDVQPGDRFSLTYIPGKGTELALNDEPKGIIEGANFAAAVFSIWLGPEPINKSFKNQILGL
jgi:hypothetical protein